MYNIWNNINVVIKERTMAKYKRVIIKLSGEALAGEKGFGLDESVIDYVVKQIKKVASEGVEVGIIIGGGNFWRS